MSRKNQIILVMTLCYTKLIHHYCIHCRGRTLNAASVKATDADIEAVMKDWLRYAKDRDGGRRRRAVAKTRQENRDGDFKNLYVINVLH